MIVRGFETADGRTVEHGPYTGIGTAGGDALHEATLPVAFER